MERLRRPAVRKRLACSLPGLLVYAVNLTGEKMLTLYAATQNKFSLCGTGTGVPDRRFAWRGWRYFCLCRSVLLELSKHPQESLHPATRTPRAAGTPVPVPHMY